MQGRERWTRPAGRGVAAALTGLDRRVFAVALDGELWSLDLQTGERQWAFPLKTWAWEAPTASAGRVFAGARDGTLFALDADSGRVVWQTAMGAEISTSVTKGDNSLYVGTSDGRLHRVDTQTGKILSSQRLDAALRPVSVPIVTPEAVLVLLSDAGADMRAVVSLAPSLDRVRWRVAARDRWSTTRILVSGHSMVLGTPSGEVSAYCTADGAPAWSHRVTGTVRSIGTADDVVYVGTVEGRVYALDPPETCGAK